MSAHELSTDALRKELLEREKLEREVQEQEKREREAKAAAARLRQNQKRADELNRLEAEKNPHTTWRHVASERGVNLVQVQAPKCEKCGMKPGARRSEPDDVRAVWAAIKDGRPVRAHVEFNAVHESWMMHFEDDRGLIAMLYSVPVGILEACRVTQ